MFEERKKQMKIRTDFVTNSSSSGFITIAVESPTLNNILDEVGLKKKIFFSILESAGEDFGFPGAIEESPSQTLLNLIEEVTDFNYYEYEDEEEEIDEEDLEEAFEELRNRIEEEKEQIDNDSWVNIESGGATSDSGELDFSYANLHVKCGNGLLEEFGSTDIDGITEWSKEHGYYDQEKDDVDVEMYAMPPYDEILKTYDGVEKTVIGKGIQNESCAGKTFVVTGTLNHFKNREELKGYITADGGKLTDSISKKTNYLINNDSESESSKNKKAKSLRIKIITEDEFIKIFGNVKSEEMDE